MVGDVSHGGQSGRILRIVPCHTHLVIRTKGVVGDVLHQTLSGRQLWLDYVTHHWVIRTTGIVGDVSHRGNPDEFEGFTMSHTFGNPDNRCSRWHFTSGVIRMTVWLDYVSHHWVFRTTGVVGDVPNQGQSGQQVWSLTFHIRGNPDNSLRTGLFYTSLRNPDDSLRTEICNIFGSPDNRCGWWRFTSGVIRTTVYGLDYFTNHCVMRTTGMIGDVSHQG